MLTPLVLGSLASANRRRVSADASPRTTSTSAQASATRQNESYPNRYTEEDQGQVEPHAERKRQLRDSEPQSGSPSTAASEPDASDHVGGTDSDEGPT
jgi:hypothetical protein